MKTAASQAGTKYQTILCQPYKSQICPKNTLATVCLRWGPRLLTFLESVISRLSEVWDQVRPGHLPRWGRSQLFCLHSSPSSGRAVLPWAAQEGLSSHILPKNSEWHHWALKPQSAFWRSAGDDCQKHLWMFLAVRNFLTDPNTPTDPTDSVKKPTIVRVHFSTYSIYHIPEEKINLQLKSLLVCSLFQAVSSARKSTFFISKNKIGHTQRNETYLRNAFLKTKK